MVMTLSFNTIMLWIAAGLAGYLLYLYKQSTDVGEVLVLGVFSLPIALLLGPLWLLLSLGSTAIRLCPHCRRKMRVDATVCPHCTRALALRG